MNRCRNRRWMALLASLMIVVSLMAMPVLSVYAAEDDVDPDPVVSAAPSIIKVDYSKSGTSNLIYDITVYILGTSDIIDAIEGSVIRLGDCTLEPNDKNELLNYSGIPLTSERKEYKPNGVVTNPVMEHIPVKFTALKTSLRDNTITFTVHSVAGNFTLSKNFTIKELRGPSSSSSEDEEELTPIAALKPHLIVDSYSYGEASAGKDVPVTFTLKNTSASKTIRNVVLTVKASGDLRIKSASDTIYVDSIQPGKTITKSMNFFLGAGAQADVQDVAISSTFEYFDIEGQNAVSGGDSITISIPTDTVERVRIQKVELPDMLYPGTEEEISYSVINAGFSTLYNCEIKVVDEEGTEHAYAYVGSLEPSKAASQPYLPIMFDVSGEKNLKFVLTYENEKLQVGEVTRDFTVSVMEMPIYEEPPFNPMPEEPMPEEPQGMAPWLLWVIIGGGVMVAVIVTVVVIKAVKKKRSELDDEDI